MPSVTSELVVRLQDLVSGPARAASQAIKQIGSAAKSASGVGGGLFAGGLDAAIARNAKALEAQRAKLVDAVAGFYALKKAIGAPISEFVKYEDALYSLRQKAEVGWAEINKLGEELKKTGVAVDQSTTEMIKGADALLEGGLNLKQTKEAIAAVGKTATATKSSMDDLSKSAIAAIQNLRVAPTSIQKTFDMMAYSGAKGAFELKEMAQYFATVASAAEATGARGNAGVMQIATALQIVRRGAGDGAEAANRLKNVFLKFTDPSVVKAFKKQGLDIKKTIEQARKNYEKAGVEWNPLKAYVDMITAFQKKKPNVSLDQLFGRQEPRLALMALKSHYADWIKMMADAKKEGEGFVNREFIEYMKTAKSQISSLTNAFENLKIALGASLAPALMPLVNTLTKAVTAAGQLAQQFPMVTRVVVGTTAALIGLKVALIAFGYGALLAKGGMLALAAAGRGVLLASLMPIAPVLTKIAGVAQIAALRFRLMWAAVVAGNAGIGAILAGTVATMSRALLSLLSPLALVRASMIALKFAVIGTGIGAVLVGIALAGTFIYNNWKGITGAFTAFGSAFMKALGPAKVVLDPLINAVKTLWKLMSSLTAEIDPKKWQAWGAAAGEATGKAVSSVISFATNLAGQVKAAFTKLIADMKAIGSALIDALLEGMKSAAMRVVNFAKGLGSSIAGAVKGAASSISSGISSAAAGAGKLISGKRAGGGSVFPNRNYIVGEKGPELLRTGSAGTIVPNNKMGGASISFAPVFNFKGVGGGDAAAIESRIRTVMRDEVRELFRAAYADTGLRFA